MELYRFDLLFSYWIFTWFIFYYFGFVKSSPKLAIIIGIIENIVLLISMIFIQKRSFKLIIIFIFLNTSFKGIPLYLVWKDKINTIQDMKNIISLFLVYLIWVLGINKKNPLETFYVKSDKVSPEITPGTSLMLDTLQLFRKIE
jgi:hypothetical protein